MLVPLRLNGVVIGTLNFGHETPGRYTDDDLEWAGVLARQIEMSLHFSTLLSTIARQGEALARERNQLEALIGASDAAIMLVRPDHTVAYANAEMTRLVGVPGESVVGTSVARLHQFLAASLDDPGALAPQVDALKGGGLLKDRVELLHPERAVYQRVVAPVRDATGGLIGYLLQYRDVTHEAELERMKSEFVSVVSHELRTPMTSIKTSLALVLAGAAGGPRAERPGAAGDRRPECRSPDRAGQRPARSIADRGGTRPVEAGAGDAPRCHRGECRDGRGVRGGARCGARHPSARATDPGDRGPRPPDSSHGEPAFERRKVFAPRHSGPGAMVARERSQPPSRCPTRGVGIPAEKLEIVFEPFTQLAGRDHPGPGGSGPGTHHQPGHRTGPGWTDLGRERGWARDRTSTSACRSPPSRYLPHPTEFCPRRPGRPRCS